MIFDIVKEKLVKLFRKGSSGENIKINGKSDFFFLKECLLQAHHGSFQMTDGDN
jgi:hypothetical protein